MGGVAIHVFEVSSRLVAAGHDVTVLTTDDAGSLPRSDVIEGVRIQRHRTYPRRGDFAFSPGIYKSVSEGRWDVVHVQSYHTAVAPLAMFAALRADLPFVVTFHGGGHSSRVRQRLRGLHRRALKPLFQRADRLVAVARFELDLFGSSLSLPLQRFVYIPNGGDLPRTSDREAKDRTISATILSLGRLERYKGHHRILKALPEILRREPTAQLWIAGDGPYRDQLRRLATRLGVAQRVRIEPIPSASRNAMHAALMQARVVVLLSEFETHPMALIEAAMLGRPVVVADNSGLSELAEDGLAVAVPPRASTEEIASAVMAAFHDPPPVPRVAIPTWDECATALAAQYVAILNSRQV